jgi:hypothetical protein
LYLATMDLGLSTPNEGLSAEDETEGRMLLHNVYLCVHPKRGSWLADCGKWEQSVHANVIDHAAERRTFCARPRLVGSSHRSP